MRLTKTIKDQIISAIMADVPEVDYDTLIQDTAVKEGLKTVPPEIMRLKDKYPEWIKGENYFYIPNFRSLCILHSSDSKSVENTKGIIAPLIKKYNDQVYERKTMKAKLEASFASITTDTKFAELFPDFVKYMPSEVKSATGFAVATTEVLDGLKKLGWPKEAAKPAEKPVKSARKAAVKAMQVKTCKPESKQ